MRNLSLLAISLPKRLVLFCLPSLLVACSSLPSDSSRIGSLGNKNVVLDEPVLDNSLEKAMENYSRFLNESPDERVTPEAIRRLADLKLQANTRPDSINIKPSNSIPSSDLPVVKPSTLDINKTENINTDIMKQDASVLGLDSESTGSFEERSTSNLIKPNNKAFENPVAKDSEPANAAEAIALYQRLLTKYPFYERNDQVMYQLARAYEELLDQERAMATLTQLITQFPTSVHYDEAQFRRGEIFFVNTKYFEAEKAYAEVIKFGSTSPFYDQSLFKRGWSLFKQSLFEEALEDFLVLIKDKTRQGYHLESSSSKAEHQRVKDTLRVSSLSFSYLGDSDAIKEFFSRVGPFEYEYLFYDDLAKHFVEKRRYSDASKSYSTFYELYPFHEQAPVFHQKIIEVYKRGSFPGQVIESKRDYAARYRLDSEYWTYHDIKNYPEILSFIKVNLVDLAKHYHSLSQQSKKPEVRLESYNEAVTWYRSYVSSFPLDKATPNMNFLLAEILFENKAYAESAIEYEKTAYGYDPHDKGAESGYAAVLAYKQSEELLEGESKDAMNLELIRSSLQFADTYPGHAEAPRVLLEAAQNLYDIKAYPRAVAASDQLIDQHKTADKKIIDSAYIIKAYSLFEKADFVASENVYTTLLTRIPETDKRFVELSEQLAASVYRQGELHFVKGEIEEAVFDYMRIATLAPKSKNRQVAEYDAASALIGIKEWKRASDILFAFRENYPENKLQEDVTKKLAFVYEQNGDLGKAAGEYERIALKTIDPEVKREALLVSAEFYVKGKQPNDAIRMYEQHTSLYQEPIEELMESYNTLAGLYGDRQSSKKLDAYNKIIRLNQNAGAQQNARTQYLAAFASLGVVDPLIADFESVKLSNSQSIDVKSQKLKSVRSMLLDMVAYGVPEVTSASTYKLANLYFTFSKDFINAERPAGLNAEEQEQYTYLLEEKAFEFEDKSIEIHKKNIEFMQTGVYNQWLEKSVKQLAVLFPARYEKEEISENSISTLF